MDFFLKIIVLLFLVTVVFGADSNGEHSGHKIIKTIKSTHWKKIIKESNVTDTVERHFGSVCPNSLAAIKAGFEFIINCTNGLTRNETMCNVVQNSLKPCLKPLLNSLEECIPEKSRGFPTLVVDAVVSLFTYICDLKGSELLELYNHCIYDYEELSAEDKKCEELIRDKFQTFDETPSVKMVCDFASELKSCFIGHVETYCQHPITRRVFRGFHDALLEPCNQVNQLNK